MERNSFELIPLMVTRRQKVDEFVLTSLACSLVFLSGCVYVESPFLIPQQSGCCLAGSGGEE